MFKDMVFKKAAQLSWLSPKTAGCYNWKDSRQRIAIINIYQETEEHADQ